MIPAYLPLVLVAWTRPLVFHVLYRSPDGRRRCLCGTTIPRPGRERCGWPAATVELSFYLYVAGVTDGRLWAPCYEGERARPCLRCQGAIYRGLEERRDQYGLEVAARRTRLAFAEALAFERRTP